MKIGIKRNPRTALEDWEAGPWKPFLGGVRHLGHLGINGNTGLSGTGHSLAFRYLAMFFLFLLGRGKESIQGQPRDSRSSGLDLLLTSFMAKIGNPLFLGAGFQNHPMARLVLMGVINLL